MTLARAVVARFAPRPMTNRSAPIPRQAARACQDGRLVNDASHWDGSDSSPDISQRTSASVTLQTIRPDCAKRVDPCQTLPLAPRLPLSPANARGGRQYHPKRGRLTFRPRRRKMAEHIEPPAPIEVGRGAGRHRDYRCQRGHGIRHSVGDPVPVGGAPGVTTRGRHNDNDRNPSSADLAATRLPGMVSVC
jgi:hypothetical protein